MQQSKLESAAEALVNILIGMGVALGSQYLVFPMVGITDVTFGEHLYITVWFTIISFTRSYTLRRFFNAGLNRGIRRLVRGKDATNEGGSR